MMRQKTTIWFVYLLECANGRLYTGIAVDIEKRFKAHISGRGAMFTRLNPPLRIIGSKTCKNRSEASKLEYTIKRLPPVEKRKAFKDYADEPSGSWSELVTSMGLEPIAP